MARPRSHSAEAIRETTLPSEASKIDALTVTEISWGSCPSSEQDSQGGAVECASYDVPLDYDDPHGQRLTLDITRRPAGEPSKRIGTLFTNPGGPGIAGDVLVREAHQHFAPIVLQQFDVVGVSPRGTSQHMRSQCFHQDGQWEDVVKDLPRLPLRSVQEEKLYNDKIAQLAQACSGPNNPIAQHASTANTARDMEVIRRAIGGEQLNFYGFGYGAVLGQTYADIYPEQVRTVVVDSGVNSDHWYGQQGTNCQGLMYRIGTPEASKMTLIDALFSCDKNCPNLGGRYDSIDAYFLVLENLRERPVEVLSSEGEVLVSIDDRDFAQWVNELLLSDDSSKEVAVLINEMLELFAVGAEQQTERLSEILDKYNYDSTGSSYPDIAVDITSSREEQSAARLAVVCADVAQPDYETLVAQANVNPWQWDGGAAAGLYAVCSHPEWAAADEDRFLDYHHVRTPAPLLIVSDYYDPVTPAEQGLYASGRVANHRVVSDFSRGHQPPQHDSCLSGFIAKYLVAGDAPRDQRC